MTVVVLVALAALYLLVGIVRDEHRAGVERVRADQR